MVLRLSDPVPFWPDSECSSSLGSVRELLGHLDARRDRDERESLLNSDREVQFSSGFGVFRLRCSRDHFTRRATNSAVGLDLLMLAHGTGRDFTLYE
jgi:hypothetical protein